MARRRMFSLDVIDNDIFQDLPKTTKYLYFELGMRADDDGFIGNPKRLLRMLGCDDDDLRLLIAKGYILSFDDGIIVIRDWHIHNQLRQDRHKPTMYTDYLIQLELNTKKQYILLNDDGNQMATNGKPRLDKIRKDENSNNINNDSTYIDQSVRDVENYPCVDKSLIKEVLSQTDPNSAHYKKLFEKYGG